jgi:diphosphomevalonate decarboxylase
MSEKDFLPHKITTTIEKGEISCSAPSNIALIKYWGKHGLQLPKNPSISFTLDKCRTITKLVFEKRNAGKPETKFDFEVFLGGKKADNFKPKIEDFFERALPYLPFLMDYRFEIHTQNTFPHGSGIASSASGMAALAMCLAEIEKELTAETPSKHKTSFLARLGSGSACRSIDGGLVVWGEQPKIKGSSNLFGIQYPHEIHPVFKDFQDSILLVDEGEKKVSSTAGHDLMKNHPFAEKRFEQANQNLEKLIPVLREGDLESFVDIVENEALSLHAMMMTGSPSYILMKPNTLKIIEKIKDFREMTKTSICFTLDAGANVHLLYPFLEKEKVITFIAEELAQYCQNGKFIEDSVGKGAECSSIL